MVTAIAPGNNKQPPQNGIHHVKYRTGNTKKTAKANQLIKYFTGWDPTDGHLTLEHAQLATDTAEYYKLQQRLTAHLKKKYGAAIKNVVNIEEIRAELQTSALEADKEISETIAKMSLLNEKHGLNLRELQHTTNGEIGIARAETLASMNTSSAAFEQRLKTIYYGQNQAIEAIGKSAATKRVQEKKRQLKASRDASRKRQYNNIITETLESPNSMPASTARTLLNKLGTNLLGV